MRRPGWARTVTNLKNTACCAQGQMSDRLFPINQTENEHQHCAYNHTTPWMSHGVLPMCPLSTGKQAQ
jgi:hypothetical protein